MPGVGLGIGVPFNRGGMRLPAVLNDGNTVKWFDFLENITKDGSDFISAWDNKSGVLGIIPGALLQATGLDQPLWSADGVLFDGIRQFMKCVAFTLVQPEMIYSVVKQVSYTSGDFIHDGNANNTGQFYQSGTTPRVGIFAGSSVLHNDNLAVGSFGIVRILFNGAGSKSIVNETTPVTGNPGANNMGGFTLGARGDGTAAFGNAQVKEIIIRKIADGATDEAVIYNYLKSKYSL